MSVFSLYRAKAGVSSVFTRFRYTAERRNERNLETFTRKTKSSRLQETRTIVESQNLNRTTHPVCSRGARHYCEIVVDPTALSVSSGFIPFPAVHQ